MTKQQSKLLQERLAQLNGDERRRLYKRAAAMRKQSRHCAPPARRERGGDEGEGGCAPKRSQESLDRYALRILEEEAEAWGLPNAPKERLTEGLVAGIEQGACTVLLDDGVRVVARLRSALASEQQSRLAVGDRLSLERTEGGEWVVERVLPRRTWLSRPDPHMRHIERVIAANVEPVVIVVSMVAPPLHTGFIDRVLVAAQRGGASPVLACNKLDLAQDAGVESSELAKLGPYREIGIPVVACSARTGAGIDSLSELIAGRLCVFVGHSGVGKSSLLNALMPPLGLTTGAVRTGDGKGRHTTTHSCLYELQRGAMVIDTPGVREFGLGDTDADDLLGGFPELRRHAEGCRFLNCTHTHEPECAVRAAVDAGLVPPERYASYRKLVGG